MARDSKTIPGRRLRTPKRPRPRVDRYADYRAYLADMYAWLKEQDRKVSYRSLAEVCGFSSPGFLHLVIHGKRNLNPDSATLGGIADGLGLSQREAKLFAALVGLNQETDPDTHNERLRKLARNRPFRENLNLDPDLLEYLGSWQAVAVRELAGNNDFRPDPVWISRQFRMRMTKQQAADALALLLRLGMLRETHCGRIEQAEAQVTTPDEVRTEVFRHYHLQMARLAQSALETLAAEERTFGAVTGRVRAADLPRVREKIHQMRKEFHAFLETLEAPEADSVVQANFQFFPLTRSDGEASS